MTMIIVTLYQFASLPDYIEFSQRLKDICLENDLKGSLLLAHEGINGTVAGNRSGIDKLLSFLKNDFRFSGLKYQETLAAKCPFKRLKILLKPEIVALGKPQVNPRLQVGSYVAPKNWNALISSSDVIVIDARNDYEVALGSFKGALNPQTETFRELPEYLDKNLEPKQNKKIAMFCTGGIRCEKATSYLLQQGFEEVYHLQGGILNYLKTIPEPESLWQGECFVFDDRRTVTPSSA